MRTQRLAACALAGALLAVAAAPAGAQEQGNVFARMVATAVGQLERVMGDRSPPPERPPAALLPCTELYPKATLEVARGPELAKSYRDWLLDSYAVMREWYGELPFPICFRWRADRVDTNLSRFLLEVNANFIHEHYQRQPATEAERRFHGGYVLTGYLDPAESDTSLARRRADLLLARLPGTPCQYETRRGEPQRSSHFYRKVYFSFRPAIPTCPRAPH